MKIGVIGNGRIARTIGEKWITAGHDVMYGLRDMSKADQVSGKSGSFDEAVMHGDIILLAIPGNIIKETFRHLTLSGKIILDATNGGDTSDQTLVQYLTNQWPDSTVYKAFNTLGFENYATPQFGGDQADLMFVGPESALSTVEGLVKDVGLNPVYIGGIDRMNILDAGMRFWFALTQRFGRHVALRILHDND